MAMYDSSENQIERMPNESDFHQRDGAEGGGNPSRKRIARFLQANRMRDDPVRGSGRKPHAGLRRRSALEAADVGIPACRTDGDRGQRPDRSDHRGRRFCRRTGSAMPFLA